LDDVHCTEDLDAAHHHGAHGSREIQDVVQRAVDAVPHPDAVLLGLDVDVRGPVPQRLRDDELYDLDDGCVVTRGGDLQAVGPLAYQIPGFEGLDLGADGGDGAVAVTEGAQDVRLRRDLDRQRPADTVSQARQRGRGR